MATRKASTTAKKTKKSTPAAASKTTTKVTTVKAVDTKPTAKPATTVATTATAKRPKLDFNRSVAITALMYDFFGTFLLTAIYIITKGEPLYLGFALIGIVLTIGTLSGAHVNPLLTVGAWVTRKMSSLRAVGYLLAQVFGAVAAVGLLNAFISGAPKEAAQQAAMLGQQAQKLFEVAPVDAGKEWYVLFAEVTGAIIFSFAVATAMRERRDRVAAALNVGFGLFIAALIAGVAASYVSAHAIINPAIALVVGGVDWSKIDFFVAAAYVLAPLGGGILGFALSDALRTGRANDEV